jgi:hypothetical protein
MATRRGSANARQRAQESPAMHRHDEIDATLAKHFAWTFVKPGDSALLLERLQAAEAAALASPSGHGPVAAGGRNVRLSAAATDAQPDKTKDLAFHNKVQSTCNALAVAIAKAWGIDDEQGRLAAVKRLLLRADRLGVDLWEMHAWPVEAVRMLRLLVRCGPRMTRRQRERSASVATFVPIDHPEAIELLVEVAQAADRSMADALLADDEWSPQVGDASALAARLADVVDRGPTHESRAIAIEFIARIEPTEPAVSALRRALGLPSFAVRARALHALAAARPCCVRAGDLARMLRDLVRHAVPDPFSDDEHEDNERIFAEAVLVALEHVQREDGSASPDQSGVDVADVPAATSAQALDEAAEALLDWIDAEHDALWLDAGWATEALAIAFPETAAAMVDHWLKCARSYDRAKALGALERLPAKLARPRVQRAASDPSPSVRDSARQQWMHRFGAACPIDVTSLVGAELLDAPPSERFMSRLVVMQSRVAEARLAMARSLLSDPPDREALVLLLQLVGDDAVSSEPLSPSGKEGKDAKEGREWAALIAERFGALGAQGLCALAIRFPEPESFGWIRRLGDLVERGAIAREHAAPLRALAAHHIASEDAGMMEDSARLLALVGAPADLLDRALRLALDVEIASPAARDLVLAWPDRAIDARLASEMALAVAERQWERVQRAASMALGRGSPAARVIAQRVLEIVKEDDAAVDAAVECAHRLQELKELDDDWALAALGQPESAIFTVAARVWRKSGAVRGALENALSSTARGGASRVEAAIALLWADPPLSPRDRRLTSVLNGSPLVPRAELVHALCIHGAPLNLVGRHLEELLASPDADVAYALIGVSQWLRSPKGRALMRAALPRVLDAELRADIEEELGTPDAPYWAEG